jgi:hypothetical protein
MANKFHSKVISLIRWMAGLCLAATPLSAQELEQRDSHQAATGFAATIETLIETMPVEQESFEVRINRCATPRGAMRDDVYAVWIGARLVAIGDEHATTLSPSRLGAGAKRAGMSAGIASLKAAAQTLLPSTLTAATATASIQALRPNLRGTLLDISARRVSRSRAAPHYLGRSKIREIGRDPRP